MANIAVIGTNYVGLVTAACFAELGNAVVGIDIDPVKVERLGRGELPIYEPGLEEVVQLNLRAGRLRFTLDYDDGLGQAEFAFVCVGTPQGAGGEADMRQVRAATEGIGKRTPAGRHLIVVNKSTMPIGTGDWMLPLLRRVASGGTQFTVVSNPEFLREGSAVDDFRHPDRVVLGGSDDRALDKVASLYRDLQPEPTIILTDIRTAEMIKYASNAFLATKISFINEIASICERLGADVKEVSRGMGLDGRIGSKFLDAGVGYGGSCFPKDVKALEHMASMSGAHPQLLRAVMEINRDMRRAVIQKIHAELGESLDDRVVGVLGLAFKPNTDDLREAPALEIIHLLQAEGASVRAYDPAAMGHAKAYLPGVDLREDAYAVADGADTLLLMTEWAEFRRLDMARICQSMRTPILVDGRNLYDPAEMTQLGFTYRGMGRAARERITDAAADAEMDSAAAVAAAS